jgi:hypothetical protein
MKISESIVTVARVVLKAIALFLIINVIYIALNPLPALSQVSVHNTLAPGRQRVQSAGGSDLGYGRSTTNIDLMLAAHEISGAPKASDEFRVLIMGDSSAWGYLMDVPETISEIINQNQLSMPNGHHVRVFNLAMPGMYATKDLLLMERVNKFEPDLVVWFVTVENFRRVAQKESFFVCANMPLMRPILERYAIGELDCPFEPSSSLMRRSLLGQRRDIAQIIHSQLDGVLWAATGIDHKETKPRTLIRHMNGDTDWMGIPGPTLNEDELILNAMDAAKGMVDAPILVLNEPILTLNGINDSRRYNRNYPRWAYDQGTAMIEARAGQLGMGFVNLWDAVTADQFTDNEVHYTAAAAERVAHRVGQAILKADLATTPMAVSPHQE